MTNSILTPTTMWRDFKIEEDLSFQVVAEKKKGDLIYTELYLNGRAVEDGKVQIYGVLVRDSRVLSAPAILVVQDDLDGATPCFAEKLAKEGFATFTIDVAGKYEGRERYTIYPPSISYANFDKETYETASIKEEVTATCWYEWGCVAKYALAFLRGQNFVSSVGTLGVGGLSSALWYALAWDKDVGCATFFYNAGWRGYTGLHKFLDTTDTHFHNDELKFLAAADVQAYAQHINCPVYLVNPTNNCKYDLDRVYDTKQRVDAKFYSATNYSVGRREEISFECFKSVLLFYKRFLCGTKIKMPAEIAIKTEIKEKEIEIEVSPDTEEIENLVLYVAEGKIAPWLRAWKEVLSPEIKKGKYIYKYLPYQKSEMASFFARATYKSGFAITSPVVYKEFTEDEVEESSSYRILYSSRIAGCKSAFAPAKENSESPYGVQINCTTGVIEKKGAVDIYGMTCPADIISFKINIDKYRPVNGMMLMFDAYCKEECVCTVKLIADYFGNKIEYIAMVNVIGGDMWQNFKIEQNKFKTVEGMSLKNYDKIEAIEFSSDGKCIVNNALWV